MDTHIVESIVCTLTKFADDGLHSPTLPWNSGAVKWLMGVE